MNEPLTEDYNQLFSIFPNSDAINVPGAAAEHGILVR
jgi:hypothetical protein